MNKLDKIFVAGHNGLVGSSIVNELKKNGYTNIITAERTYLDLRVQNKVDEFFNSVRPDIVILAAAKVGGIMANSSFPAEFLYDNIMIQTNVIHASYKVGVKRLLFLGSGCIYPKILPQPIKEEYLLTGSLEKTNEAYAIAKISGLKMCESYNSQFGTSYFSVMPCNIYGENDNYNLQNSHVVPALIRKFHEARESGSDKVLIWGTGKARREFMHVEDLARACVLLLENQFCESFINVGFGFDISIQELSELIAEVTGYGGRIEYDYSKPDGTPQKLLDSSKIFDMGWSPKIDLRNGLERVYKDYLVNNRKYRK